MLNDRDLAGLANRLHVPLVVQDVLNGQERLSDDICYGLHDVLSEQQPDSALLAIALGAQKIAARYIDTNAALVVLKMEAERVIDDYGQSWLSNARAKPVDEEAILARLTYVPEDLQALSELLEVASVILQDGASDAAELCRVLMVQADAHMLIAETFTELMDEDDEQGDLAANDYLYSASAAQQADHYGEVERAGNVVLFPCGSQLKH